MTRDPWLDAIAGTIGAVIAIVIWQAVLGVIGWVCG